MHNFSKSFHYFTKELSKERYRTYRIYDLIINDKSQFDQDVVHVGIRLDVDSGLELCVPLAEEMSKRGLKASFYFLTHPERYYDVWNSEIPLIIHRKGFEVGIHSDHYFEEITQGIDALPKIKEDIDRLSAMIGEPIKGMVAHGHPAIERAAVKCIWDIYKDVNPRELGLKYHDETLADMLRIQSIMSVLDYLGVVDGWRYWPQYPRQALRRVPLGSIVIFMIHPQNLFNLNSASGEILSWDHVYHFVRIRLRHQIIGSIIGEGKSVRKELKKLLRPKCL